MTTVNDQFATWLASERARAGLSQERMAGLVTAAGVPAVQQYIAKIEAGQRVHIPFAFVVAATAILGATPDVSIGLSPGSDLRHVRDDAEFATMDRLRRELNDAWTSVERLARWRREDAARLTELHDNVTSLRAERDRFRSAWQSARFRAKARGEGILREVQNRDFWHKEVQRLRTALADAAKAQTPAPTTAEQGGAA
ncbi:helix-turn-helix domain-containing protein [Streptomyces albidoflavus]